MLSSRDTVPDNLQKTEEGAMSLFSCVTPGPPIEVLHMKKRFDEDQSVLKINTSLWVVTRMTMASPGSCL